MNILFIIKKTASSSFGFNKNFIIDNSYDENYGARPIKRFVSRNIETLIAKEIINGNIKYNSEVIIDVKENNLVIKKDKD